MIEIPLHILEVERRTRDMTTKEIANKETGTEIEQHEVNYFASYGEEATARGNIIGSLLKFNKGDWLLGQDEDEINIGTKFVAIMDRLDIGWQKWEDGKPAGTRMGKVVEGFQPPRRKDLGDSDETEWEVDDQGNPRDPWQFSNNLILRRLGTTGETDDDLVTFITSSRGGIGAIGEVCKIYGKEMRSQPDRWPIIELGVDSYNHSNKTFGRIKVPVLKVVGWEPKVVVKKEAAPPKKEAAKAAARR